MDRFVNREAVRLAFEEVPVLDAVRVRRQDGAVRTGIGLCTLNRITTTAARHVNWQRHALRRGRCDETLAACRWKTSLAVLPCQRRWTPWFFPAYWRWSERLWTWRRPSGHLHCKEWRWDSWNFPTLGHMGKKRRQGRLRPVGAESRRRERNSGRWSTGRQPTTWTTGAVREACAGSTWTRIGRSRHARLAQRLRQGGYPEMWKLAAARTPRSWRWPI